MVKKKTVTIKRNGINPLVYIVAIKFHDVAKSIDTSVIEPFVVNHALAIELFLKCLSVKMEVNITLGESAADISLETNWGHKLDELFSNIHKTDQIQMTSEYNIQNSRNIEADLKQTKEAFITYRYAYEHETLSISTKVLEDLSNFIRTYVEQQMLAGNYER